MNRYGDGFSAPILWGWNEGYLPASIAAGLEISETTVRDVLEVRLGIEFGPIGLTRAERDQLRALAARREASPRPWGRRYPARQHFKRMRYAGAEQ
jgi:hypothetical protein